MNRTALAAVLTAAPLLASGPQSAPTGGHWTVGLIGQSPDFVGTFQDTSTGSSTAYDTEKDLGLGKDSRKPGVLVDYEGSRFRLHLATYGQDYAGNQVTSQDVIIDGKTYHAGTQVKSQVRMKDYEFDWTIKLWRWEAAYLGLDLGANVWDLDVHADGTGTVEGNPVPAHQVASVQGTIPIPQVGLSVGGHFGDKVDALGYYHFMQRNGASYHRAGVDVRFFPVKWLGLRANYESENLDAPLGSLNSEKAAKIDKNGGGFGVLFRF